MYEEGHLKKKPDTVQEPLPELFPDLYWIWEAFTFLQERRSAGPNGPNPISTSDMESYINLTGRVEQKYRRQMLRFIPPLDRIFLSDFYEKQSKEMEKIRNKAKTKR